MVMIDPALDARFGVIVPHQQCVGIFPARNFSRVGVRESNPHRAMPRGMVARPPAHSATGPAEDVNSILLTFVFYCYHKCFREYHR